MASVSVNFTRGGPDPTTGAGCYFITAEVTASENMPTSIFCLQVSCNTTEGARVAVFSHVANMADLSVYPEGSSNSSAYFRVSSIKLVLPSADILKKVEENLKKDIQFLVTSINTSVESSEVSVTFN